MGEIDHGGMVRITYQDTRGDTFTINFAKGAGVIIDRVVPPSRQGLQRSHPAAPATQLPNPDPPLARPRAVSHVPPTGLHIRGLGFVTLPSTGETGRLGKPTAPGAGLQH
jgi:hypothetical protein